jgi:hypothetical protein
LSSSLAQYRSRMTNLSETHAVSLATSLSRVLRVACGHHHSGDDAAHAHARPAGGAATIAPATGRGRRNQGLAR